MRVLLLHNYYQQSGGEDVVVEQEKLLLESNGHDVQLLTADNHSISSLAARARVAMETTYSLTSRRSVGDMIRSFRPNLVHVHNFFPLFSPSVYDACRAAGVPVVQTLHNFRLICAGAVLFRGGRVCEACVGKTIAWPGILYGCYRNSRTGTASLTAMVSLHKAWGTWNKKVDAYIALTKFGRDKLIAGGVPSERLWVKPNFVFDAPAQGSHDGGFGLFVGRLSAEKGISNLISAWSRLAPARRIKIAGDGPLLPKLRTAAAVNPNIEILGKQSREAVRALMKQATFLLFPSRCYETFGMVIVEAYAAGLPVLASRLGSMAELVRDGETGMLFDPDDPAEIARCAEQMFSSQSTVKKMSAAAREEYYDKYTSEENYKQLMHIYRSAGAAVS
jgi:glycosyltransferase involved in cell wall biosynthesis